MKQDIPDKIPISYQRVEKWANNISGNMGIEIEVEKAPPPNNQGCLVVPNHRSYADIVLVASACQGAFVAKAEVTTWPFIGSGIKMANMVLVKRESKDSRKAAREAIRKRLELGYSVIVYPEGTTYKGPKTTQFRLGGFQVAAEGGFKVMPVALEYEDIEAAWVTNEFFLPHYLRTFGGKKMRAKIRFGDLIEGDDGMELLRRAQIWVDKNLLEMRAAFDREAKVASKS